MSLLGLPWHDGEEQMHYLLGVPRDLDNPTVPGLNYYAHTLLPQAPLIAIGTLDAENRPWTTILGGSPGLSQALNQTIIGIKTPVDYEFDPVVEAIFGKKPDGSIVREEGNGKMISALTIDLMKRKRVKLYGRLMAGGVTPAPKEEDDEPDQKLLQLVLRIDQSLGNCPKYLNSKHIRPAVPCPCLVDDSHLLGEEAIALISKADLFFLSSSNANEDMDTNHRGGSPGFTRVAKRGDGGFDLIWAEYSGNRLYQTLGNLQVTPKAGLVFPDFDTGDVLYLTGATQILIGSAANAVIPRSNLAVRLSVQAARYVKQGLPFRGDAGEFSPYNPRLRLLATEALTNPQHDQKASNSVTLLEQTTITPTISRFRFTMSNPASWKAGQWIALDFSDELDEGYSHMRDEDPRSLNDDFVRTFTISSPPAPRAKISDDEFEITIRRIGTVTAFLFKQNPLARLEIPVRGVGGSFRIDQFADDMSITPFVAAGVGITPLLAHLPHMDCSRLKCFWAIRANDLNLILDTVENHPLIATALHVFITGWDKTPADSSQSVLDKLKQAGVTCELRRFQKSDFDSTEAAKKWYICVNRTLYQRLQEWLPGKEFVYDDFEY